MSWYENHETCVYNTSINCGTGNPGECLSCGWNPEVSRKRQVDWLLKHNVDIDKIDKSKKTMAVKWIETQRKELTDTMIEALRDKLSDMREQITQHVNEKNRLKKELKIVTEERDKYKRMAGDSAELVRKLTEQLVTKNREGGK